MPESKEKFKVHSASTESISCLARELSNVDHNHFHADHEDSYTIYYMSKK